MFCKKCGSEISENSQFCEKCGAPVSEEQEKVEGKAKTGFYIAILGSAMLIAGFMLPWVQIGLFSVSGYQKIGDSFIFLIIGGITIILALLGLAKKGGEGGRIFIVLLNLGAFLYLIYIYYILSDSLSGSGMFKLHIGSGYYISAAGAFIAMISGLMLAEKKEKKENKIIKTLQDWLNPNP